MQIGDSRIERDGEKARSEKGGLTLAESSVALWPSSATSGAVGTETGSRGDLAFPAKPRDAVFT